MGELLKRTFNTIALLTNLHIVRFNESYDVCLYGRLLSIAICNLSGRSDFQCAAVFLILC